MTNIDEKIALTTKRGVYYEVIVTEKPQAPSMASQRVIIRKWDRTIQEFTNIIEGNLFASETISPDSHQADKPQPSGKAGASAKTNDDLYDQ